MASRLSELAHRLRQIVDRKEQLEQEKKDLNGEMEQVEQELKKQMDDQDVSSLKLDGVGTIYMTPVFYVRANKENLPQLISWLDNRNLGELAPRSVNYNTLQSNYKEWLKNNQPLPDEGLLDVKTGKEIRLRRS